MPVRQLTPIECARFRDDGVLRLGRVLSDDDTARLAQRLDAIVDVAGREQGGGVLDLSASLEGPPVKQVLQLIDIYKRDPVFREIAMRPDIVGVAQALLGPRLRLLRDQCFYKAPGSRSKIYLHQDNRYWHIEPPDCVTVWIALDSARVENGCVHYLLGSNRSGRVHHHRADDGRSVLLEANVRESDCTPFEVEAGHGLVHHCQTVHYSPRNDTPSLRRGYTIQYVSANSVRRGEPLAECPQL